MNMREEIMDIKISEKSKVELIDGLLKFCKNDLDVEIGNLGASSLFDHITKKIGKAIYNQAIDDAKEYYQGRHNEIDIDSCMLLK